MPKKILVLVSNPKGTPNLNLLPEIRNLKEALRRSVFRERFVIEWEVAKHQSDLRRHILDVQPQIIHFCGHGTHQGLMLEDGTGTAQVVPNEVLIELFRLFSDHIECVVLNSCYSSSLADGLVKHLNYVIGMKKEVFDDDAISFAEGFYDALGAGELYPEAFEIGRSAVFEKSRTWTSHSRKIEVIDDKSESISPPIQQHLIAVLKAKVPQTVVKPWLHPADISPESLLTEILQNSSEALSILSQQMPPSLIDVTRSYAKLDKTINLIYEVRRLVASMNCPPLVSKAYLLKIESSLNEISINLMELSDKDVDGRKRGVVVQSIKQNLLSVAYDTRDLLSELS